MHNFIKLKVNYFNCVANCELCIMHYELVRLPEIPVERCGNAEDDA